MKKLFKITAVATMAMLLLASVVVSASTVKKQIKAVLNKSTKFTLNGSSVTLKDDKGKKVYPIQYDGKYYVPVNSMCNMLKTPVVVSSKKNVVTIGVRAAKSLIGKEFTLTRGNSVCSTVQKSASKAHLTFPLASGKVVFKTGIIYSIESYVADKDLTINVNGKYSKLSFSVIGDNDTPLDFTVVNGDTDVELGSVQFSNSTVGSLSNIPIGGVKKLIFRPGKTLAPLKLTIGNPVVK